MNRDGEPSMEAGNIKEWEAWSLLGEGSELCALSTGRVGTLYSMSFLSF